MKITGIPNFGFFPQSPIKNQINPLKNTDSNSLKNNSQIYGAFINYDRAISAVNQGVAFFGKVNKTGVNRDLIIELYKNGKSTREIAQVIGCSQLNVYQALKRWGEFRPRFNSEENTEYIINLHNEGKSVREIASIINCSESTIYKILADNHVSSKKFRPEHDVDKVRKLVSEGKGVKEISYELKCSPDSIYYTIRRYGIEYKSYTDRKKDEIIQLHNEGHTVKEISEIMGCSIAAVRKALIRWGYTPNQKTKNAN